MSTSSEADREGAKPPGSGGDGGPDQTTNLPDIILQRSDSVRSDASSTAATTKANEARLVSVAPSAPPEPPDGGWGWMIVFGAILSGALVPSLFMCFGVFMNAFLEVFPGTSKSSAAWIPSIMTSLMNGMGPITSGLVNLYSARVVTYAGSFVLSAGLVLSYFTNSIQALYLTYGVLGGIGAGLSIAPGLYLISQYFKNRRGLATGVCMAGSSIGQIITPYLVQILLDEYNYKGCMLILGGMMLNICVTACLFRPLQSAPKVPKKPKKRRTLSNSSHRSSLTFIPEEGICMTKGDNYVAMSVKNNGTNAKKHSDPKKKRHKKSKHAKKKKKNNQRSATKNEIQSILLENTWNSIKQNDPNLAPPRSRSRTLSMDSSRILPDIPEEHEDDDGDANTESEPEEGATDENVKMDANDGSAVSENHTSTPAKAIIGSVTEKDIGQEDIDAPTITSPGTDVTVSVTPVDGNADVAKKYVRSISMPADYHTDSTPRYVRSLSVSDPVEVVSLHNCYGSVASIASIASSVGPSIKGERHDGRTICKSISQFFGLSYFKYGVFYVLSISFTFLIVALGNYTMFIPTYGLTLNLSKDVSAGLVSVIAIASMFGRLILPTIPDYVNVRRKYIYMGSCMFSAGAAFLTIFAANYETLLVALIVFGFTSGGSIALSIGVFLEYVALDKFTAFFGLMQLIVGIVNLFATPLIGFMVDTTNSYVMSFSTLTALSVLSGGILYFDRFTDYQSLLNPTIKPKPILV